MDGIKIIQNILHYATLPGAMGLFCLLVFMLSGRERGKLLFLGLSAAASSNLLLKLFFKVPRPWLTDPSAAPYLAEGGYALPCLHTQLTAAVLCSLALTSRNRMVRFLCAAGIWLTGSWRLLAGLQTIPDVLSGLAAGLLIAFLLCRFWFREPGAGGRKESTGQKKVSRPVTGIAVVISGTAAALADHYGWGLGTALAVICLELLEKLFSKADPDRTAFGRIYGTVFAAGIYAGLIIFLPFLIEWLITPLWPGQTLIVFLITLVPCLLRLFPIF